MTHADVLVKVQQTLAALSPADRRACAAYYDFLQEWLRRHGTAGVLAFVRIAAEQAAAQEAQEKKP